jgi:hypothetical protein
VRNEAFFVRADQGTQACGVVREHVSTHTQNIADLEALNAVGIRVMIRAELHAGVPANKRVTSI